MSTGLEIVVIKDGKARLYKVRHDGCAIGEYINVFKVPQGNSTLEALQHFKEWFFSPTNYGPEGLDDIETNYPQGFEFVPKGLASQTTSELICNAEDDIQSLVDAKGLPNGATDEGFLCSYSDWVVLFDLDNGKFEIESEQSDEEGEPESPSLSPQEQLEAMRLYVQSMEKVQGYSKEDVRNIIDSVYRRFILVLNYSALSKMPEMREVKAEMKKVLDDELNRYKDEEVK